jgi:hypothetical protein
MLFELLLIGLLRDADGCRVFHRDPNSIFYLEIPNSPNNKTARALRICLLFPTRVL